MPSTSTKQARTMAAAAHNPSFAKKMGIPVSVAKEFNHADHLAGLKIEARSSPTPPRRGPPMKRRISR